jgi:hypothetical protein
MQQHDAVGKFRGQIQFVRHHHHGVAIFVGEPPQPRSNSTCRRCPGAASAHRAAAARAAAPARAPESRAAFRRRKAGPSSGRAEHQRPPALARFPPSGNLHRIRSAIACRRDSAPAARIPTRAAETAARFPAAPGDLLRAGAQSSALTSDAVHFHAPRKRLDQSGEQFQQRRFSAGVRSQDRHQLALLRLENSPAPA